VGGTAAERHRRCRPSNPTWFTLSKPLSIDIASNTFFSFKKRKPIKNLNGDCHWQLGILMPSVFTFILCQASDTQGPQLTPGEALKPWLEVESIMCQPHACKSHSLCRNVRLLVNVEGTAAGGAGLGMSNFSRTVRSANWGPYIRQALLHTTESCQDCKSTFLSPSEDIKGLKKQTKGNSIISRR
jgi:hypothetical protein